MTDHLDPTNLVLHIGTETDVAEKSMDTLASTMIEKLTSVGKVMQGLGLTMKDMAEVMSTRGKEAEDAASKGADSWEKLHKASIDSLAKIKTATQKDLGEIEKLYEEYGIKATSSLESAAHAYEAAIKKVKEDAVKQTIKGPEAKLLIEEFEHDLKAIQDRIEDQKKKGGLREVFKGKGPEISLAGDVKTSAKAVVDPIMEAIPGLVLKGGFIGLLLYGLGAAEASRVQVASAALQFRTEISTTAEEVIGNVADMETAFTSAANNLKVTEADLSKVYQTLGNTGMSAKAAGFDIKDLNENSQSLGITAKGLGADLGILSVAVDKSFNLPIGQTAKDAAQIHKDLGTATGTAVHQMENLRISAMRSGEDVDRYILSVMTAGKTLGQFGIDLGATTSLMEAFGKTSKEGVGLGLGGLGAATAIAGVGTLFGSLQSNVGMSAYMGQRVYEREHPGEKIGAIEARSKMLMAFEEAKDAEEGSKEAAAGKHMLANVLREVQAMAAAGGGSAEQQALQIEQQWHIGHPAALAIQRLKEKEFKAIESGEGKGPLSDAEKAAMGFGAAKAKENAFETFIKQILSSIKDIMIGILQGVGGLIYATGHPTDFAAAAHTAHEVGKRFSNALEGLNDATKEMGDKMGQNIGFGAVDSLQEGKDWIEEKRTIRAHETTRLSKLATAKAAAHPGGSSFKSGGETGDTWDTVQREGGFGVGALMSSEAQSDPTGGFYADFHGRLKVSHETHQSAKKAYHKRRGSH